MNPWRKQFGIWVPDRSLRDNRGFISPGIVGAIAASRRRSGGAANFTADVWETFELSAVTAAQLEANDNNASATWIVSDASSLLSVNASAERATLSTVNSTADTGTLGLKKVFTSTATANLALNLGADKTSASIGFWFQITGTSGTNKTLLRGQNNGGSDSLDTIVYRYSTQYIGWGSAGNNNGTALTAGSWYWITIKYVQNSTSTIAVYDSTGAQVGSNATATAPNVALRKLYLFDYNAQLADGAVTAYIDDFCVDYTSATFPLGP